MPRHDAIRGSLKQVARNFIRLPLLRYLWLTSWSFPANDTPG